MKTKHTPGPWVIRQNGGSQVSIEKSENGIRSIIAETYYSKLADEHGGNYEANARLIAAAPDMLAALRIASLICAKQTSLSYADRREAHEIVMNAIAKAEGRA